MKPDPTKGGRRKHFRTIGTACWLALVTVAASAGSVAAQDQVWSAVAASGPVSPGGRTLVWFDGHARFREGGENLDTTILRPGIGYRLNNRLDFWVGYAEVTNRRAGPDIKEHRFWQQATYPVGRLAGGTLSGRTRLEQRAREGGDETGWRLRQFIRWSRPVTGTPVATVISNETFMAVNDTDWGQRDGFDQNRAFIGLAWQATAKIRVEGGYLNQHLDGGPGPDTTNDNLSLALFASF